jgi:putative restriction endonuclease
MEKELKRRELMFDQLMRTSAGLPNPSQIRELGMYGGAQGIYRDSKNTAELTEDGSGVTVSILHTGRHYDDDMGLHELLYHYPKTDRPPSMDQGEIQATKNAGLLGLPIFVISNEGKLRQVRIGFVEDWDDAAEIFLISLQERWAVPQKVDGEAVNAFELTAVSETKLALTASRPNQAKFRFSVLKRYGHKCAVCHIKVTDVLAAAHIRDKRHYGSDDPRNGIVLCQTHHTAFDKHLFGIDPSTYEIKMSEETDPDDLGITEFQLTMERGVPHQDALAWRWSETMKAWK